MKKMIYVIMTVLVVASVMGKLTATITDGTSRRVFRDLKTGDVVEGKISVRNDNPYQIAVFIEPVDGVEFGIDMHILQPYDVADFNYEAEYMGKNEEYDVGVVFVANEEDVEEKTFGLVSKIIMIGEEDEEKSQTGNAGDETQAQYESGETGQDTFSGSTEEFYEEPDRDNDEPTVQEVLGQGDEGTDGDNRNEGDREETVDTTTPILLTIILFAGIILGKVYYSHKNAVCVCGHDKVFHDKELKTCNYKKCECMVFRKDG